MALGALAATAAGVGLGNLAGQAIMGSRSDDLVDAPVTGVTFQRQESYLDPKQLQQLLDDLTRAEGIARGDITGSLGDALSTLQRAEQQIQGFNQPAIDANKAALQQLQASLGLGGQSGSDLQKLIASTPGYQFQFDQGRRAVERSAANRGLLESGALLQELTKFGQGLANTSYGDYQNKLLGLANATSNQALAGQGQLQQVLSNQAQAQLGAGQNLADLSSSAAAQRSSALLQGGKQTRTNQQFNVGGLAGLDVTDLLNEAPGFRGFVTPDNGQKYRYGG